MTTFTQGQSYHNFTLIKKEAIAEIHSTVYQFKHDQLGCYAFGIKNTDPNKTFCISFLTIPEDSTGVAHILEHSVLMGSKKYPVHDVFGEINKGGLMTFLNAMTGSDTTWYPFATRNLKEYFNIMDVYCDVTLHPLLHTTTFEQEGWHYHLEKDEDNLEYSGVVLNEMKGAFSDPIRSLFHQTFKELLPGSTYAHESGGDPANIPDLSYEQFVAFHQKHYHPSNGTFFFYGDADLLEELAFVDNNFLQHFSPTDQKPELVKGTPTTTPVYKEASYPVQPGSDHKQKTFLAVSSIVGTAEDRKKNVAFQIIANILFNSDASPLKNAIINARLCRDFGGVFLANSSFSAILMTYLIGSDPDKREAFQELYTTSLLKMIEGGLDKELVLSELNKYEFGAREEMNKAQRGLDLVGKALPAMKFGLDPFASLQMEQLLAEIRTEALEHNLFEHLIQKHLLDNPATAVVTLTPDPDKLRANLEQEQTRLRQAEEALSTQQRSDLIARTNELIDLQSTPNPPEKLRMLPRLSVPDLDTTPDMHQVTVKDTGGTQLLASELDTNGISYLDFGFDCSGIPAQDMVYLDLFGTIFTEIGTKEKNFIQFAKEVNQFTGGFSHSFNTYLNAGERSNVLPVQWYNIKTLSSNLEKSIALLHEALSGVNLEDRDRIREIVQREYAWAEHSVQSEGYMLATSSVFAGLSQAGMYSEHINGAQAYLALKQLAMHYDQLEETFLHSLSTIKTQLFSRDALIVSATASGADLEKLEQLLPGITDALPEQRAEQGSIDFKDIPASQAFHTSAEVVYNVQGCTLFSDASHYKGSFEVLKTWLSRDYLWNTVRQKGGAYGCFVQFNHLTGNFGIVSYRDPQVDKTYAAYNQLQQTVANMDISDDMLSQLIIGTYGGFTPHQGPATRGATARNEYLSGITPEFKLQRIKEITTTTAPQLKEYAEYFNAFTNSPYRASIGNGEKIAQAATTFAASTAL
ncbi:MAG: peptidase M16 [Desulfobulbus propionicus]|nr:MAG: peptidase M16 [Desulfobulbus propionicus]